MTLTTKLLASQLQEGMIVWNHGMRVRIDSMTVSGLSDEYPVYAGEGTILNVDEVDAAGNVPKAFRARRASNGHNLPASVQSYDSWTIQSNDLHAGWSVEVTPVIA